MQCCVQEGLPSRAGRCCRGTTVEAVAGLSAVFQQWQPIGLGLPS